MAKTTNYLELLEKCGWFEGWPRDAAAKYRRRIAARLKEAPEPWIGAVLIEGDVECIDGEGDFTAALKDIAKQSCGLIKPRRIKESWDDDPISFSFELGGERFSAELPLEGDYLPGEFHALLARAVNATCKPLRLRSLASGGQDFLYVLVSPQALKAAVKKKLIPAKRVQKEAPLRVKKESTEIEDSEDESSPVLEQGWFKKHVASHAEFAMMDVAKVFSLDQEKVTALTELAPLWNADPRTRINQARALRERLTSSFTILPLLFVCPIKFVLTSRTVGDLLDGFTRRYAGALETHDARIASYATDPEGFFRELDIPGRLRNALAEELGVEPGRLAPDPDLCRELGLDDGRLNDVYDRIEEVMACPELAPSLKPARTFGDLCRAAHREVFITFHAIARKAGLKFAKVNQAPDGSQSSTACFTLETSAAPAEPKAFGTSAGNLRITPPLTLAWRKRASGSGDFSGLGRVGGGRLFVALKESNLEAWDLRTGDFLWKTTKVRSGVHFRAVGGLLLSTIIEDRPRGEHSVYRMAVLDPETGQRRKAWDDFHFLGEHAGGLVFRFFKGKVGRRRGFLVLDPESLKVVLEIEVPATPVCVAEDNIVAVEHDEKLGSSLVTYSLASGKELARKLVSDSWVSYEDPRHSHENLVVTVFAGHAPFYVSCRQMPDLGELWRLEVQPMHTYVKNGRLLVSTARSGKDLQGPAEIQCLDVRTGKLLWKKPNSSDIFLPQGDNLYWTHCPLGGLRRGFHRLTAMSLDTGEPVWSCDVEGKDHFFLDACASGQLYCRTCNSNGPVETICFRSAVS